ncbi:MAG TPA: permease-like cell division protein FtsX [Gaiellaceae bacterium]|jgi:cell division transport system permease protein
MRLRLLVSEAWRSLAANLSTTVAATVTVLVGMFILGLFIAVFTLTDSYANHVKHELVIRIDFKTNANTGGQATRAQETAVARMLQADTDVKKWSFVSKATALAQMKKEEPQLVEELPYNPLPDSFQVTATNANLIGAIVDKFSNPRPPGVQQVLGAKKLRSIVLRFAHVIDVVFLIGSIILVIASTLLIGNTIRLSIFSRRREIEVMKLVGATNWFVRGPFMIEGLLCGGAGALLAVFFLVLGKQIALPAVNYHGFSDAPDVHAWSFPLTALVLLCMGFGLGALGSGLTLRRFLKV